MPSHQWTVDVCLTKRHFSVYLLRERGVGKQKKSLDKTTLLNCSSISTASCNFNVGVPIVTTSTTPSGYGHHYWVCLISPPHLLFSATKKLVCCVVVKSNLKWKKKMQIRIDTRRFNKFCLIMFCLSLREDFDNVGHFLFCQLIIKLSGFGTASQVFERF